ncbi:MAG: LuxR C-terminal-related transcriptional regulator [Bacteroidia bacterium]
MNTINSVLIAGSTYFRYHVGVLLEKILPEEVNLSTTSEKEVLKLLKKKHFEVTLLEEEPVHAPATVQEIKKVSADIKVILFMDAAENSKPVAADFVLPRKISKETGKILKEILLNPHKVIDTRIVTSKKETIEGKTKRITQRGLEMFKGIWDGLTTEEIAERHFIAPKTVDKHRTGLHTATKTENLVALIKHGIINGWIGSEGELTEKFMKMLKGD